MNQEVAADAGAGPEKECPAEAGHRSGQEWELAEERLHEIPNETYHALNAVGKSTLDLVAQSPALVQWDAAAPEDEEAASAVDLGNAFEALLLEPTRFADTYIVDTPLAKNTKEGKAEAQQVQEEADRTGKAILSPKDYRRIELMQRSALAHPTVYGLLMHRAHIVQRSWIWTDAETGVRCKCRPDLMLTDVPLVADVKIAGQPERFGASVQERRYHVQDAMYTDGMARYYGERPNFVFIVVSSAQSARKYPVHVYELEPADKSIGHQLYRRDLNHYAGCLRFGEWKGVEPLTRPSWAHRLDETIDP